MSAAEDWKNELQAWAIPEELLAAVEESPYQWPAELWKRSRAREASHSLTGTVVRRLLPAGGTLLDVGAGTGRSSLHLAREGHRITAVEKDHGMAEGFREEAAAWGIGAELLVGAWPEAAREVDTHDVVLCAHVVYDVQEIAPFLLALHDRASRGVVLELTPSHPWAGLAPYYRALHGLARPSGPTSQDLASVVEEILQVTPAVERWSRGGTLWFADRDELVAFCRRRLVLPEGRTPELRALLEAEIVERDGRLYLGGEDREMVTMWWEKVESLGVDTTTGTLHETFTPR